MATPQPSIRRRVLGMAGPIIGENLLQTLLGIVDTLLVAGLGAAALVGVGTALNVSYILTGAMLVVTTGASVLVAQAIGGERLASANRLARQALTWTIIVAVPISLIGYVLTPLIIGLFGLAPDATQVAIDYMQVTIATFVTLAAMLIASSIMRGAGDSRTPLKVTILINIINLALTYALIYGHWGFPAMGAVGSAWGTSIARLIGASLLLWLLWRGTSHIRVAGRQGWQPELEHARAMLRIGLPAAIEEVVIVIGFAALTPIIAVLGTDTLAAHRAVITILSFSFLPGIGFAIATTALVGQAIGAEDRQAAQEVTAEAGRWALIWMGAIGLLLAIFAPQVLLLFNATPAMLATGIPAIQVTGLIQAAWAGTFVFGGALRGTGDTRTPLIVSGIMMWLVVGLAYLIMLVAPSLAAVWAMFLLVGPIEVWLLWRAWRKRLTALALTSGKKHTEQTNVLY
jgi:multidrug resistance protein, MATE family